MYVPLKGIVTLVVLGIVLTLITLVSLAEPALVSFAITVIVLFEVPGEVEVFLYRNDCKTSCTFVFVASLSKVMVRAVPPVAVPPLTLKSPISVPFAKILVPLIVIAVPSPSESEILISSAASALPVICATNVPPFQSASPSASLTVPDASIWIALEDSV